MEAAALPIQFRFLAYYPRTTHVPFFSANQKNLKYCADGEGAAQLQRNPSALTFSVTVISSKGFPEASLPRNFRLTRIRTRDRPRRSGR